jgi:hypothetical protein
LPVTVFHFQWQGRRSAAPGQRNATPLLSIGHFASAGNCIVFTASGQGLERRKNKFPDGATMVALLVPLTVLIE